MLRHIRPDETASTCVTEKGFAVLGVIIEFKNSYNKSIPHDEKYRKWADTAAGLFEPLTQAALGLRVEKTINMVAEQYNNPQEFLSFFGQYGVILDISRPR